MSSNFGRQNEQPPRISIIGVAALITGKGKNQAAEDFRRRAARYPDVKANCIDVEFKDSRGRRGQKDAPVQNTLTWNSTMLADEKANRTLALVA